MSNSILALTKKFIRIKSTPDNKEALQSILRLALDTLKGYKIEHFERNGFKSALIYNSKRRPPKFKVLLNGHLDIIPGKAHQYLPQAKNNRLYGVGSMDMKANVACLISAFKQVAYKVDYPLGLQLVTDEEIGGFDGTKYQIDEGVRADFVIAGESTNFDIVNQAKGVLWINVSCKGETAHGAYPWRGENAIWKMTEFLSELRKIYPVPKKKVWETTVNLSQIKTSNHAINKIPDDCTVLLDIRFVPGDSNTAMKQIKKILPREFRMEVLANEPALDVDRNNPYLKTLRKVSEQVTKKKIKFYGAQGSSDARHFSRIGCPGVEFGPIGKGIGTDKEWVDIRSLGQYTRILEEFLLMVEND